MPVPPPFLRMKSAPDEGSIQNLAAAPRHPLPWTGVLNFKWRKFIRNGGEWHAILELLQD